MNEFSYAIMTFKFAGVLKVVKITFKYYIDLFVGIHWIE